MQQHRVSGAERISDAQAVFWLKKGVDLWLGWSVGTSRNSQL